jgi:hypothetical protein
LDCAGLDFGRRLKAEQPQLVAAILHECAGKRLEDSRSVIQKVVAKVKRIEPISLIRPLLEWYRTVHEKVEPQFYGQSLAWVGCFADFAVWIPWLEDGQSNS